MTSVTRSVKRRRQGPASRAHFAAVADSISPGLIRATFLGLNSAHSGVLYTALNYVVPPIFGGGLSQLKGSHAETALISLWELYLLFILYTSTMRAVKHKFLS
jgi:hypothetical protein